MKYAGLIFDESFHFIDHLAPFCSLMGWPLITLEESVAKLARQFYPDLEVIEEGPIPPCVVSCDNKALLDAIGLSSNVLWLPHGLSDKGWKAPFFEALGGEDLLFVYGQKMRDTLAAKNVAIPQFCVGNFRYEYYKKHRGFYEELLSQRFGEERFILYAPTWEDSENNGTFWEAFVELVKVIPKLLIKLHPNTEKKFGPQLERYKGKHHFLEEFPPIYPVLERTDLYIGDMSSIGYDFLTFQRPMVFLRKEKTEPTLLMKAGVQLTLEEIPELFNRIAPTPKHNLVEYAFESAENWSQKLKTYL